jgi:multidrug resistance efflux pump
MSLVRRMVPVFLLAVIGGAYLAYRQYLARLPYEWSGTVEVRTVQVGSRAGGRVKEVLVREGDHVAAGQALVVLEPGDLEAQRLIAEGQLLEAQANLDKLKKGARPEEIAQAKARAQTAEAALHETRTGARREEVAAAEERLAAAQAQLDKATADADRAAKLLAQAAISQAEADTAQAAVRAARGSRNALAQTLAELRAGARDEEIAQAAARSREAQASASLVVAGARAEDIAAGEARVRAAQGRLDQVGILLGELTVKAPRAARVETLDLRPGDLLAPNAPAARLFEDGQLYLRIYVPETQLGLVRVGQSLPVVVDSFPGRRFSGVVESISDVGEYSPRNLQTADERADQVFAARIGLRSGAEDLRAGMAAVAEVAK